MNAIEIRGLVKTYDSWTKALKWADLTVESGDFFALLGPNGAGKSTMIGILTGLVNKTEGNISVMGYDMDQNGPLTKTFVGVVPQEFNCNIFEKCIDIVVNQAGYYGIPYSEAYPKAKQYLESLGLGDKLNTPSRMLSGGMKRRLMIARALVHDPRILILDEPTAGVDVELRREMWTFLRDLNAKGVTIILTTHYLEEAEALCNKVAIIRQGEIVANGDMREVLSNLSTESYTVDIQRSPTEAELNALAAYSPTTANHSITLSVGKGQRINDVLARLESLGLEVISLRNSSNRLEAYFLELTK